MRLLNVETYQLEHFLEDARPPYAILSHTWGDNETTYQDVEAGRKRGEGWNKIEACCRQAVKHGYEYVWVDTCCIDKTSSAELSEAINSMYRWYKDSEICYVYMSDVPSEENPFDRHSAFRSSRWFSRGWTLQEFLAPKNILFFGQSWTICLNQNLLRFDYALEFGRPQTSLLVTLLSDITTISPRIVATGDFSTVPIAQRLSWASHRTTTRIEDMAYSLLGIIGINMPLLYGEGKAAFQRLQEEALKTKMDQSCLCWGLDIGWDEMTHEMTHERPHLSESPTLFRKCGALEVNYLSRNYLLGPTMPQSVTNQGVQIEVPVIKIDKKRRISLALLPYGSGNKDDCIAIPLQDIWEDSYFRRLEGIAPFTVPFKSSRNAVKKKICLLSREHVHLFIPHSSIHPRISWFPSTWTGFSVLVELGKLLTKGYRMAGYYPPQDLFCQRQEGSLAYRFGIDFLFLEFTNGLIRIGVSFRGLLRSKSCLRIRLFRIHSGSTLAVAFSVRRLQYRVWGRTKSFEEHVLLEECCSSSTCESTFHLHLLHQIRYHERGHTNVYLHEIQGDRVK